MNESCGRLVSEPPNLPVLNQETTRSEQKRTPVSSTTEGEKILENWVAHWSLFIPEHTGCLTRLLIAHCSSRSTLVVELGCSLLTVHPGAHWFLNWVANCLLFILEHIGSWTGLLTSHRSSRRTLVLELGCSVYNPEHVWFRYSNANCSLYTGSRNTVYYSPYILEHTVSRTIVY